ncbi:MAG TPA: hypoxanthine phosphoribosyltransferase [Bacteroidia bacterium]|nr:hypoxanthine phosphoribosyltransferase [Bacteroidia bacterium]
MPTIKLKDKEFTVMIASEKIQLRVKDIASEINTQYHGKQPLFLGVLNGAFLFMADLFKNINLQCEISFIKVTSYVGTASSGQLKNLIGLNENVSGRDIIVVEDIVDTGDTMKYLLDELKKQNPASVKLATILFKPEALRQDVKPDYVGFEIPPAFVVGYGLDYDGLGRNLNDIYVLK